MSISAAPPGLELISYLPDQPSQHPAVLFVHGSCVGAWVWEETFLPYFRDHGFPAHAVSLSGHGQSDGHDDIRTLSLRDYTRDVQNTIHRLGHPLVIVGHSMGGAVAQNVIRSGGDALALVLMASVPPHGLGIASANMMIRDPALWHQLAVFNGLQSGEIDLATLCRGLFSNRIPVELFREKMHRTLIESPLIGMELSMPGFAPFPWQMPPVLVMGGSDDRFLPQVEIEATAAYFGTSPRIIDGMSHTLMLDPDWKIAADIIIDWIDKGEDG